MKFPHQQTQPFPSMHGVALPTRTERTRVRVRGVTWWGLWLALLAMLVGASAFPELRIEVADLLVHPYLLPTAFFFFLLLVSGRIAKFPRQLLIALGLFIALYVLSTLPGEGAMGESLKILAAGATLVTSALLVRNDGDFMAGLTGLVVAGAIIGFRGVLHVGDLGTGANALEGIANENATSVYLLPPMLLAGYALRDLRLSKFLSWAVLSSVILMGATIFLSASRSGWLGVIVVAGMLLYGSGDRIGKKIRIAILLFIATGAGYYLFDIFDSGAFTYSVQSTLSGHYTDNARVHFFVASIRAGLEHPFLGVSPMELPYYIGNQLTSIYGYYSLVHDPHNVVGHLIGGSGFLTFGAFVWFGWLLWRRKTRVARLTAPGISPLQAHHLLRLMLVLYLVRGMFTREILYSPSFCIGLGLIIGLCVLKGLWRPSQSEGHHQVLQVSSARQQ